MQQRTSFGWPRMQRRVRQTMGVKGLYLSILFVFRVPQSASVFPLFAFRQQRTNVHTVLRPGACVPRAWRRWRRSKGRSPGFIALCEVSSSSYLSRHQILLVPLPNLPLIIASSSSPRRLSCLAFVRFAFRSAPSSQRSGLRYICLAVGSGARLCSPPRQTQKSVLCVTSP